MSEHTPSPGPWTAMAFCSPPDTWYVIDRAGQVVFGAGHQITEANARLAAAAPDLLQAANVLLKSLDHMIGGTHAAGRLREAIAKAEGRKA